MNLVTTNNDYVYPKAIFGMVIISGMHACTSVNMCSTPPPMGKLYHRVEWYVMNWFGKKTKKFYSYSQVIKLWSSKCMLVSHNWLKHWECHAKEHPTTMYRVVGERRQEKIWSSSCPYCEMVLCVKKESSHGLSLPRVDDSWTNH